MAAYATVADVEAGFHDLSNTEESVCTQLLEEAAVIIDAYSSGSSDDAKKVVSCRMVRRAIGDADTQSVPIGATQGSMSGLGYAQSWTLSNGSAGELYLSKLEKKLLGVGDRIGSAGPLDWMVKGNA